MTISRYELNKPLLVIGFYTEKEGVFKNYTSLNSLMYIRSLLGLNLSEVNFTIMSIIPNEEHCVEVEYSKNKAKGYKSYFNDRSTVPNSLNDFDIHLVNQYPTASYGQLSTDSDYYWKISSNGKKDKPLIPLLSKEKFCWRYEDLSLALEILTSLQDSGIDTNDLVSRILKTLETDFNAWVVKRKEIFEEGSGMYETEIYLNPILSSEKISVSDGPVSSLPGKETHCEELTVCDEHPNRLTVVHIQGETDSFGCEYLDMCKQCYEKYKEGVNEVDLSGTCDWCKKEKPVLHHHRDIDEGSAGRIYDVCDDCIRAEHKYLEEPDFCDHDAPNYYDDDDLLLDIESCIDKDEEEDLVNRNSCS